MHKIALILDYMLDYILFTVSWNEQKKQKKLRHVSRISTYIKQKEAEL